MEEPANETTTAEPEPEAQAVDNGEAKPKRRPKTTPKKERDERFEEQKRALQRMTLATLKRGEGTGLSKDEVRALRESLRVLGWLPTDLQL